MKLFVTIFFILFYYAVAAQNKTLDSLNAVLIKTNTDTARINLMNKISNILQQNNLDSANRLAERTILISKSKRYTAGEAEAHRLLAAGLCFKSNFSAAIQHLALAEKLFRSIDDPMGVAKVQNVYGMYYGMQSKYDSSTFYLTKSLAYTEHLADPSFAGTAYQNIAVNYQMQSDFIQALAYEKKALSISDAAHDYQSMSYIFLNISVLYEALNDRQRTEEYLLKAIAYAKRADIINVEQYAYANLATLYNDKEEYGKSYDYAMKAYELGRVTGDQGISASSLSGAALALAYQANFAEAETFSNKAIRMADSSGAPLNKFQTLSDRGTIEKKQKRFAEAIPFFEKAFASLKDADIYTKATGSQYEGLSECYEATGNYAKALATYRKSALINDSLKNRESIRKATELSMNYEFDKKQQAQQAAREKEDKENTIRLIFLIAFLLVFILLAAVAVFAYKREQKAKSLINGQKKQAEHTLAELKTTQAQLIHAEKMASLGELTAGIAHEIQNPLNFVNNFSEVNKDIIVEMKEEIEKGNYEEVKLLANDIEANEEKIAHHGKRADGIVKNMLQHSRSHTGAKVATDINALCDEYLKLSFHGFRAKDKFFNADVLMQPDKTIGSVNIASADIGRVLLNVFNNAFYAVHEKKKLAAAGYQPRVEVKTGKDRDTIVITIKDNGNGMSRDVLDKIFQPFFTTKPTGSGTGLGLSLSYDIITKQHNGSLTAGSVEGEGSWFVITLPAGLS